MNKTEARNQKPRTSELAIASLVISLLVPCAWLTMAALPVEFSDTYGKDSGIYEWLSAFVLAVSFFWLAVPVLSATALVKISRSGGLLEGERIAIAALIVWAAVLTVTFGRLF